jgi:hypothetical protein
MAGTLSRRRVLLGAGALALGTGSIAYATSERASAEVTMGQLSIDGDDAGVSNPPERIDINVDGEFSIASSQTPERVEVVCQVHVDGTADDIATVSKFEVSDGTYSLSANLYEHRDVAQGDLTPSTSGEVVTTELTVRIICGAIVEGERVSEDFVEDSATIEITKEGMQVNLSGSGSVDIVTPS